MIALLTLVASAVGTLTGFGTSTIMVPVMVSFFPLPSLDPRLAWGLLLFIPVSFIGAKIAECVVERIPQARFRYVVAVFLCLIGLKLLLFPAGTTL